MKLAGLIFLFCSASLCGFFTGNRYINMLKDISRAENLLKNIVLCLKKEKMTVYEILENCSLLCDSKTKMFLSKLSPKTFYDADFLSNENKFCSEKNVNYILKEAFSVIGRYSAEDQISEIEFCRKKLNEIYLKNENEFRSKSKLSRSFGVLAGAFLIIIFI